MREWSRFRLKHTPDELETNVMPTESTDEGLPPHPSSDERTVHAVLSRTALQLAQGETEPRKRDALLLLAAAYLAIYSDKR